MKAVTASVASCEKEFVLQCIRSRKRIDGRETYDFRKIEVAFGVDRGNCEVQLGKTRVMAQVSCEMTTPKANRPTEGQLFINLDLSPMASPAFESARMSEYGVELNRSLERFFVESRAIDLESLCIVAGEKVWSVRVDVHVLDHGGNILDCASIATISALAHFRRPDVSVVGEEVTVHSAEDRAPVPLGLLHMPVCITFAFFDEGRFLLMDPTEKEECVMNGRLTMAMNIHREICGAVMSGGVSLETEQVLRCSKIATVKVTEILELVQQALAVDTHKRTPGQTAEGLHEKGNKITKTTCEPTQVDLTAPEKTATGERTNGIAPQQDAEVEAFLVGPGTAQVGEGGKNAWITISDDDTADEKAVAMETDESATVVNEAPSKARTDVYTIESDDSEEEDVVILTPSKVGEFEKSPAPAKNENEALDLTMALKRPKQAANVTTTKNTEKRKKKKSKK